MQGLIENTIKLTQSREARPSADHILKTAAFCMISLKCSLFSQKKSYRNTDVKIANA